MLKKIYKYLLIITILILYSCNNSGNKETYISEFCRYLTDIHKISIDTLQNTCFYCINTDCGCSLSSFELLENNFQKKIIIIACGKETDQRITQKIQQMRSKYLILYDYKTQIEQYRTNFAKALCICFKKGKCSYYGSFFDNELEKTETILYEK